MEAQLAWTLLGGSSCKVTLQMKAGAEASSSSQQAH